MLIYLVFKESTFYAGIKIVNNVPLTLTALKKDKVKFKAAFREVA
jgi:hypothetical protein